jgi:hypothetical protein
MSKLPIALTASGQEPPAALLRQINSGGSETVRHVNWDAAIGLGSPSLPQDVEPWAPARARAGVAHPTGQMESMYAK